MLPDSPWLRKSPSENVLFWSDECKKIGQIDAFRDSRFGRFFDRRTRKEWRNLDHAVEPLEQDYFDAIDSGIADTDKKRRYLRVRLWWRGNDAIRCGFLEILPKAHRENLRVMAMLLSEEDERQRLMKAEALRELGLFDEAMALLEREFPEGMSETVKFIRDLAAERESRVSEIQ